MQTFKQYLSESRMQKTSAEAFIKWCDAHASKYLSGKNFLYRGAISGDGLKIGKSAKDTPRVSGGTHNNYMLWIDGSPSFDGWPKRSRSFIGIDKVKAARGFGNAYLMIPRDDDKIGLSFVNDLWWKKVIGEMSIVDLNEKTEECLKLLDLDGNTTYEQLATSMKQATVKALRDKSQEESVSRYNKDHLNKFADSFEEYKVDNLFELWAKNVTADKFGLTTGAKVSQEPAGGEVWIEGECAFLPIDSYSVSLADRVEVRKWADKKYPNLNDRLTDLWDNADEDER